MNNRKLKIYIAGHTGLVGSAILNRLKREGYANLLTKTHRELDLVRQLDVGRFLRKEKPEIVILAAAKVGGIFANMSHPVQFLYDNICIQINIINSAFQAGVRKLLFFGSACSYPRKCPQPIKEEYLLSGPVEPTNEPYAIAKIAGIKMCQAYNKEYGTNFISVIPANAYGPGDNFSPDNSHVIPSLIGKFHRSKIEKKKYVTVWGTGRPLRDFIYVDDLADACLFLMRHYNGSDIINVGSGCGVSIRELACTIKKITGFNGNIIFDSSKPDGMPKKILDMSRLKRLGWQPRVSLKKGIADTYRWYRKWQPGL